MHATSLARVASDTQGVQLSAAGYAATRSGKESMLSLGCRTSRGSTSLQRRLARVQRSSSHSMYILETDRYATAVYIGNASVARPPRSCCYCEEPDPFERNPTCFQLPQRHRPAAECHTYRVAAAVTASRASRLRRGCCPDGSVAVDVRQQAPPTRVVRHGPRQKLQLLLSALLFARRTTTKPCLAHYQSPCNR